MRLRTYTIRLDDPFWINDAGSVETFIGMDPENAQLYLCNASFGRPGDTEKNMRWLAVRVTPKTVRKFCENEVSLGKIFCSHLKDWSFFTLKMTEEAEDKTEMKFEAKRFRAKKLLRKHVFREFGLTPEDFFYRDYQELNKSATEIRRNQRKCQEYEIHQEEQENSL